VSVAVVPEQMAEGSTGEPVVMEGGWFTVTVAVLLSATGLQVPVTRTQ
jgi:hypothetical protein